MKTVKKLLSLVLALIMAIGIVGCKDSENSSSVVDGSDGAMSEQTMIDTGSNSQESSKPQEISKTEQSKKNLNFNGQTVTIIYEYQPSDEYGIDASRDRELDRIKELNKKYNVKIVMKKGPSNYNEAIVSSISSGVPVGNIIRINGNKNYDFIRAGLCADIDNAMKETGIDMSAAHYDQRTNKYYNVNGKQYVMAYVIPQETLIQDLWFYNKDVLTELGYSANYINELYQQGKWNWSQVSTLASKATKTAANGTVSRYGLGFRYHYKAVTSMVLNNGGKIGSVDPNGNPKVNFNDAKVREALQQAYQWGAVEKILSSTETTASDNLFTKGELFMYCANASFVKNCYTAGVNFGVIYPPVGPSGTKSMATTHVGASFMIPVTYQKDAAKYLMLMDELYGEYKDASREEIFKADYIHLFNEENSWNVIKNATLNKEMQTNDDFTVFNLEWTEPAFSTVCQNLVKGGVTAGRIVEMYNDQYQAVLDELFKGYALTGVK